MKSLYLLLFFVCCTIFVQAQNVTALPPGKYTTKIKATQSGWEKGDVILMSDGRYRLSSGGDDGDYRFSAAAQRIFFTSGPLKGAFTKVAIRKRMVPLNPRRSTRLDW